VEVPTEIGPAPGAPRSEADAAYMARFDRVMRVPIIISAVLPLIVVPESGGWLGIVVGIVTWLVFLVDYVVRTRHIVHYHRTAYGRFDLFVVVGTAPWFLIPGLEAGRFVVFLRLVRLARLMVATGGARRLLERLGKVALFAMGAVFVGSAVAYHAEHPVNSEFATFGDALWWGIVTLTTVGYGDIVPKTTTGRWAAVFIMITGIAVLGLLSGSLASFFRMQPRAGPDKPEPDDEATGALQPAAEAADGPAATAAGAPAGGGPPGASPPEVLEDLAAQVSALRTEIAAMAQQLRALGAGPGAEPQASGDDEGTGTGEGT
jgi:voltage-gated potassium channel